MLTRWSEGQGSFPPFLLDKGKLVEREEERAVYIGCLLRINIQDPKPKRKLPGGKKIRNQGLKNSITYASLWQIDPNNEQLPSAWRRYTSRYQVLGLPALSCRQKKISCKYGRWPISWRLDHENWSSTLVEKGSAAAAETMATVLGSCVAWLGKQGLETSCKCVVCDILASSIGEGRCIIRSFNTCKQSM